MMKLSNYKNRFILILTLFILGDVVCDNFLLNFTRSQDKVNSNLIVLSFLLIQIISAPFQAAMSDYYCRKKSLIISLVASFIGLSLILLNVNHTNILFGLLLIALAIKGFLGNTTPLSWAAIGDVRNKDFRYSLAISTTAYAYGYLAMLILEHLFNNVINNFIFISYFFLLIVLAIAIFEDIRDKNTAKNLEKTLKHTGVWQVAKNEALCLFKLVFEKYESEKLKLKSLKIRHGLISFILWELSLYSLLILLVDFHSKYSSTGFSMMSGYLLGVLTLKYCKKHPDLILIKIGYFVSLTFSLIFFALFLLNVSFEFLLPFCCFFHTLGNAFLCPTIMSFLTQDRPVHDQGKIFGLIISADSIAFLLALLFIMVYKELEMKTINLISFSFTVFLLSWWPFSKCEFFNRKIHID